MMGNGREELRGNPHGGVGRAEANAQRHANGRGGANGVPLRVHLPREVRWVPDPVGPGIRGQLRLHGVAAIQFWESPDGLAGRLEYSQNAGLLRIFFGGALLTDCVCRPGQVVTHQFLAAG